MEITLLGMVNRPNAAFSRGGFDASVTIRDESGNERYYGPLGRFASKDAAISFAAKWAVALINGDALPWPPFRLWIS